MIERRSRELAHRSPAEIGFEITYTLKIEDVANGSQDGRRLNLANPRNSGEDLPFARVLNEMLDLDIELLDMLTEQSQFPN